LLGIKDKIKIMRIAIVKLSALGDIVHAMVGLQFIKNKFPHSEIDWFVESQYKGLLENNKDINKIYTLNLKELKKNKSFFQLIKALNRLRYLKSYDIVLDAQGLIKSAIIAKLIPSKKTCGFDRDSIREKLASIFYNCRVRIGYDKNTIDRNVKILCSPLGIEVDNEEILNKLPFLKSSNNKKLVDGSYAVFVIGSNWESRNYPKEKFKEVADQVGIPCCIIWGNNTEREKALWIEQNSENCFVAWNLSIDGLKSLISNAKLVIGNDTGPTHMAWGLNIPSITIFGPTPVSRIYETPMNKYVKSSSVVDPFKLNKEDFSINEILPQDIVKIAQKLLKE